MKRYWDLSEKERAALTDEQVTQFLDAELMEQGVVRIEAPAMLDVAVSEVPATKLYVLKKGYSRQDDVAYQTAEDAAKAMALGIALDVEYVAGNYMRTLASDKTIEIATIDVYSKAAIANHRKAAEHAAANRKANEQAQSDYREACEAVNKVCNGVWDDHRNCQAIYRRYQRVVATFEEYRTICEGDEAQAKTFLAKAFPQPDIDAAFEWFGVGQSA